MTPSKASSKTTIKPIADDVRIKEIKELLPPSHIFKDYPVSNHCTQTTYDAR